MPKDEYEIVGDPTSIRIPPDIKRLLDKHALEQRRPRTYIILEILRQWMAFHTRKKKDKTLRDEMSKD